MPEEFSLTLTSLSPEDTRAMARKLSSALAPGAVIALNGELGSGKTCFVQGLAQALASETDAVSSPTFTYVNEYPCRDGGVLAHMDMYRVNSSADIVNFAPEEYFETARLSAVEWASRIRDILPEDRLEMDFSVSGRDERIIVLRCADKSIIEAAGTALKT